jgi:hypothetical protein
MWLIFASRNWLTSLWIIRHASDPATASPSRLLPSDVAACSLSMPVAQDVCRVCQQWDESDQASSA